MGMTHHAEARSQQRGIPPIMIDLLIRFGNSEKSGNGTFKYFFDKKSRRKIQAYIGGLATSLDEHLNLYIVVGENNCIVTIAHRLKRIKRS